MSEMNLSIIIPVYNTAGYLRKCLESLLSQMHEGIELVIVDDGSTDGSSDICDSYCESYTNVTVVHQANAGVSAARNVGIDLSHGAYLWFCDSDDRVLPGAIDKISDIMRRERPALITFPVIQEDAEENQLGLIPAASGADYGSRGPLQSGDLLYPYAHIARRDLVGNERFDVGLSLLEDRDFMYRVCSRVRGNAFVMNEPLYAYFITRQDSAVNSLPVEKYVSANVVQYKILAQELDQGRREPAYTIAVEHTLGVLAMIARTGCCNESFSALRERMMKYDAFARDLKGSLRAKYVLCRYSPFFFKMAFAIKGLLTKKKGNLGKTVLVHQDKSDSSVSGSKRKPAGRKDWKQ